MAEQLPIVEVHDGIHVVRDDLFPGGTKARFIPALYDDVEEVVYATPCEGGAQTALAHVAAQIGKRATLFCAARKAPHPRTLMAQRLGAKVYPVSPGYLNVVQARAVEYADQTGAKLAEFGIPQAVDAIAEAALATGLEPDEVWCASGSGTLARGLAKAWPWAARFAVQVGRDISARDTDGAIVVKEPLAFGQPYRGAVPFPSDPHYDAKAWAACKARHKGGLVVFWNVTGPAAP